MFHVNKRYKPIVVASLACSVALVLHYFRVSFLLLKFVASLPFLPTNQIDNLSDLYNAICVKSESAQHYDSDDIVIVNVAQCDRSQVTNLLGKISSMSPKVIGLDVVFDYKRDDSIEGKFTDSLLLATLRSIDNIVLPIEIEDVSTMYCDFGCFHDSLYDKKYGIISNVDKDGVRRRFTPYYDSIPFFSYLLAKEYNPEISISEESILINYTTLHLRASDALDAIDILKYDSFKDSLLRTILKDKVVLIGATNSTDDVVKTPCGSEPVPGVLVHAHIVNMLLSGKTIFELPNWIRIFVVFIFAVIYCYFLYFMSTIKIELKSINWIKSHFNAFWRYTFFFIFFYILFAIVGTTLFESQNYYLDFSLYILAYLLCNIINNKLNSSDHEI